MNKDLASIPLPQLKSAPRNSREPELQWVRALDGIQLNCRVWRGEVGQPVILHIHGLEGHSQWFENSASALNAKGMTVYAPDRRGSGLNPRDRGHIASYEVLVQDIDQMLVRISQDHAGHPIIIWGHCWGARLAALVCQDADKRPKKKDGPEIPSHPIAGLVLSCPAIYSKVDFDLKTKLTIAINHFMGDRRALRKLDIPITPSMFTDNPTYIGYIDRDPLRIQEATSTFFFESHKLAKMAGKAATNISIPIIILQSGSDQIVDIPKMEKWLSKTKSSDKSMRLFPDAHHSLDFDETWFKEYMHLISGWLMARQPVVS